MGKLKKWDFLVTLLVAAVISAVFMALIHGADEFMESWHAIEVGMRESDVMELLDRNNVNYSIDDSDLGVERRLILIIRGSMGLCVIELDNGVVAGKHFD